MGEPWDISRQIADQRRRAGLSLSELARRADTSAATLSRYESGWTRFEVYTLRKLATALGCRLVVRLEPRERASDKVSAGTVARQLGRLFWEQDLTVSRLKDHPEWVMRRVLEHGRLTDLDVLLRWLGRSEFLRIVSGLRFETDRTREFWRRILDREGVPCTNESFQQEAATSWPPSRA